MLNKQNSKWKQNQRQREPIPTGERVFRHNGATDDQRGSWWQKMQSVASLKPPRHITEKGSDSEGDEEKFWSKVGKITNVPAHFSPAALLVF